MIDTIVTITQDIKRLFARTKELPLTNRIFAYILFLFAFILLVSSVAVFAVMTWGAIDSLLHGDILDNPPAEEWDIR